MAYENASVSAKQFVFVSIRPIRSITFDRASANAVSFLCECAQTRYEKARVHR